MYCRKMHFLSRNPRSYRARFSFVIALLLAWTDLAPARGDVIRIHSTAVAAKVLSLAAPILKERGIELRVATEGGSGAAITSLSNDSVDVAVTVRNITALERSADPEKNFTEQIVAYQVLALIVPADVWNGGVR